MHINDPCTNKAETKELLLRYPVTANYIPLTNRTWFLLRDLARLQHSEHSGWKIPLTGFDIEDLRSLEDFVSQYSIKRDHCAHIDINDSKGLIWYYRNRADRLRDRLSCAKPGKYITANYKESFNENTIRDLADTMRLLASDMSEYLMFAETEEEIEEIYTDTSSTVNEGSCMRYEAQHWNLIRQREYVHPSAVYAGPDTRVAYIMIKDRLRARTVVLDKGNFAENKKWIRIYGDVTLMESILKQKGYQQDDLDGARLSPIKLDDGGLGAPYFDGDANCSTLDGPYIKIGYSGTWAQPSHCECLLDRGGQICDDCSERFHEDELTYTFDEDRRICESCQEHSYRWATHRHGEGYIHEYDCVYVESDECYYHNDPSCLEHFEIIETESGYFFHDEVGNRLEWNPARGEWYEIAFPIMDFDTYRSKPVPSAEDILCYQSRFHSDVDFPAVAQRLITYLFEERDIDCACRIEGGTIALSLNTESQDNQAEA